MAQNRISTSHTRPVFPSPTGLITSWDETQNRPNIITLGEVFNLSIWDPVIVGIAIAPARHTNTLITKELEFVVNLPAGDMWPIVNKVGSCSGRDTDKFALTGLTQIPADFVKPPLIAECVMNIECKVREIRDMGDHDLFEGVVQAVHLNPAFCKENGKLDPDKLSTIVLTTAGVFGLGDRLGMH